jgi:HEAT repeat protein
MKTLLLPRINGTRRCTLVWLLIFSWAALTQEPPAAEDAKAALIQQLKSPDWKVRQQAVETLKSNRSMSHVVVSTLIESIPAANENARFQISSTLGLVVLQVSEAIPTLEKALKHSRPEVRAYAAFAFTSLRDQASGKAVVPALLDLLHDKDARVRGRAVQTLGSLDPANSSLVSLFVTALRDPDAKVRMFAAGALGRTGSGTPEVRDALTIALRDEAPEVRMIAADVLGGMKAEAKEVASAITEAQFNYITNQGAIVITGYIGSGGEVVIPDKLKGLVVNRIGNDAFRGCYSVTSLRIPSSVSGIGDGAFTSCNIANVTIPSSVINIGLAAFGVCANLSAVTVDDANPFFSSVDGVLLNKSQTTLIQDPGGRAGSYTIPNSVIRIGEAAFMRCNTLTGISIPDPVTSIGNDAFAGCSSLTTFPVANGVTQIGTNAFSGCSGLASAAIPSGIKSLRDGTFSYCTGLTNVWMPKGVTSIGQNVFSGCTGLTTATIPSNVTNIGDSAYFYCTNLTSLAFPDSVTRIGAAAYHYCINLTNVTIPASVSVIGNWAFGGCPSLKTVRFLGNAPNPATVGTNVFTASDQVTVYRPKAAQGWGSAFGGRPTALE